MLVIFDDDNSQGFSIHRYGDASRCDRLVSGHYLLAVSAEDFSSRDKELGGVFGEVLAECFISYRQKS